MSSDNKVALTGPNVLEAANAFLQEEWLSVLPDLERLVSIDSSEDLATVREGAPFGDGPRAALDEAFDIVRSYGFEPHDCGGHCGYFQVDGTAEKQLGIIGHLDVVPAGDGWNYEPFALTREGDYLIGRGTTDDKGPVVMALHALRFWRDRFAEAGHEFPVNVRMIFGCAEETGMHDADRYLQEHAAPDFLFTPDADFPLCYGEKGHYQVRILRERTCDGVLASLRAGNAVNGVPGSAWAFVKGELATFPPAPGITVSAGSVSGTVRIDAEGAAGHAAMPEGSVNALGLLAAYLLEHADCEASERQWLEFVQTACGDFYGQGLGISCADDDFGPLTCVASVADVDAGRFSQAIDVRFPTSSSLEQLGSAFEDIAERLGGASEVIIAVEPLLVSPTSPQIQALRNAYEEVTGCEARLFTMGGGTYAHHFPVAVSFGAMDEQRFPKPEHLGGMHAADEGVAEECLRQALLIYIVALGKLFALDWS